MPLPPPPSIVEWRNKANGCIQIAARHLSPSTSSTIAMGRERRPASSRAYPAQAVGFTGVRIGRERKMLNNNLELAVKRSRGKPAAPRYVLGSALGGGQAGWSGRISAAVLPSVTDIEIKRGGAIPGPTLAHPEGVERGVGHSGAISASEIKDGLTQMLHDKGVVPGPDCYDVHRDVADGGARFTSTAGTLDRALKFQGSTAPASSMDARVAAVAANPSPAKYGSPTKAPLSTWRRKNNASSFARSQRVPPGFTLVDVPSPVAYSPQKPRRHVPCKISKTGPKKQFAAIEERAKRVPAPGDYHYPPLYGSGAKLTGERDPANEAATVPMARKSKKIALNRLTLHKRTTELSTLRSHQLWHRNFYPAVPGLAATMPDIAAAVPNMGKPPAARPHTVAAADLSSWRRKGRRRRMSTTTRERYAAARDATDATKAAAAAAAAAAATAAASAAAAGAAVQAPAPSSGLKMTSTVRTNTRTMPSKSISVLKSKRQPANAGFV